MDPQPLRVVVADDESVLREAITDVLGAQGGVSVVGTAADHREVVEVAGRTQPDVVVLDVRMPHGTAAQCIERLRMESPGSAVVALSAFDDADVVLGVIAAGASGYLLKGAPKEELVESLHRAVRRQLSMSASLAGQSVRALLRELERSQGSEAGLRRSRATLQDLVDRLPVGVILVGDGGRIVLANAQADRLFQRPLSGLADEPAVRLLAGESRDTFSGLLREVVVEDPSTATGDRVRELVGLRADGRRFAMSVEIRPMAMAEERLAAVFVRDLSESRALEMRYHRLIEASPDALLIVDGTGRIELLNSEAERAFCYDRSELLGAGIETILPAARSGKALSARLVAPTDLSRAVTMVGRRHDGTTFSADVRSRPLSDESGGFLLAVQDVTERRQRESALEETFRSLEEAGREHQWLLTQLVRAQEDERKRIAAGIHDDTLQAITAAALRVQQLRGRLREREDQEVLTKLEETLQLSIARLRHLIFDLRPPTDQRGGLLAALEQYVDQLDAAGGPEVQVDVDPSLTLSQDGQVVAYRIAQEALTNVWRHAAATHVRIKVLEVNRGCLVVIDDDGLGYDPSQAEGRAGHLGLSLMHERAEIAGGWCRVESAPGAGTTVQFWLPGAELSARSAPGLPVPSNGRALRP